MFSYFVTYPEAHSEDCRIDRMELEMLRQKEHKRNSPNDIHDFVQHSRNSLCLLERIHDHFSPQPEQMETSLDQS